MDNLNPHTPASLYEAIGPTEAGRLIDRLGAILTPKHGSGLNTAEIELGVRSRGCRVGHIPDQPTPAVAVNRRQKDRNTRRAAIDRRFTTADGRIKP